MSALSLQSSTVKNFDTWGGFVYVFSANGVDVYLPSLLGWSRVAFSALANVTCGAVNDNGLWLGTSDAGVWFVPHGSGNLTRQLENYYAETGADQVLQSNNVQGMAATGTALLICTDTGAEFAPAIGANYVYDDSNGCTAAAINGSKIAYAINSGIHVLNHPTADWDSGDVTALTAASSPALSSNTVNDLRYGTDLFIATGAGVDVYDNAGITTIGSGSINTVWPSSSATQSAGYLGYGNGSNAIILDISAGAVLETHSGATTTMWLADTCESAIYNNDLELHAYINNLSPFSDARGVTRDWTLYFEAADTLFEIDGSGVAVKVNGVTVSATVTSFGSGFNSGFSSGFGSGIYKVTYDPASASGYRQKITVEITLTNNAGLSYVETFTFQTETNVAAAPSVSLPPDVLVVKDLSLTSDQAEDAEGTIYVNYGDEIRSALIVTEEQAQKVGTVEIEKQTYHRFVRTVRVKKNDSGSNNTRDINKGDLVTITATAIGMTSKKCEVLAKQREIRDDVEFTMIVAYYEVFS